MEPDHRAPDGPHPPTATGPGRRRDRGAQPDAARGLARRVPSEAVVVPPHGTAAPPHAPAGRLRSGPRPVQVLAGDHLLSIDPADGSEVAVAPRERIPGAERRGAADRAARARAVRPAPAAVPHAVRREPLERDELTGRLVSLLARGRSVRLTGPAGSGRTVLLAAVADRCEGLAPDGVVRLSGHRRTPVDLLHDLYAEVYRAEGHRPGRARLREAVRGIGAVVVLDDLEFGGAALEELLGAARECAFLLSATARVPAPSPDSAVEEVPLPGLTRAGCARLLARILERELTQRETAWANDVWFASEGLPLRFVQAAALLRGRSAPPGPGRAVGAFGDTLSLSKASAGAPYPSAGPTPAGPGPLPSPAAVAAPADLLAGRLGQAAREALRVAVALGGECVDPSHLPALVGAEKADAAQRELIAAGLVTPVASHYRLAAGVLAQLADDGSRSAGPDAARESAGRALAVARHLTWWAGHPSVPAARVAAEADAILAAAAACRDGGEYAAAVRLARAAAPVFAAALDWGAWERALRTGQEAARLAGEVAAEAYFHHELGVLALCEGNPDRARTELEASIGMRGALGDRLGGQVGRRALALLTAAPERPGAAAVSARPAAPAVAPPVRRPAHALPPGATPAGPPAAGPSSPAGRRRTHRRTPAVVGARRNLAAAGAGAVLAALLGTVVTLAATSDDRPSGRVDGAAAAQDDGGVPVTDQPTSPGASAAPSGSASVTPSGSASARVPAATRPALVPGTAGPTPSAAAGGYHSSTPKPPTSGEPSASPTRSTKPSSSPSPSTTASSPSPSGTPSGPAPSSGASRSATATPSPGTGTPSASPTPTVTPTPSGSAG